MAVEMSYDDTMKDVNTQVADKSVIWTCKDKKTQVTLRPLMLLQDKELKVVSVLLRKFDEIDDEDFESRIEVVDQVLSTVADKKEAFKKDMADFPATVRTQIFATWFRADDEVGEASDSES